MFMLFLSGTALHVRLRGRLVLADKKATYQHKLQVLDYSSNGSKGTISRKTGFKFELMLLPEADLPWHLLQRFFFNFK